MNAKFCSNIWTRIEVNLPRRAWQNFENQEHIDLTGLQSSDKYLKEMRLREQERRNKKISKKKKKKQKRGKKNRHESESDEDDIPVMQAVSSAYDLPEVMDEDHCWFEQHI